jgi:hypothetical protein
MKYHRSFLTFLIMALGSCALTTLAIAGMMMAGASLTSETITLPSAAPASAAGTTYYVRSDGGSDTQCTGLVDAAYPGSGTAQPCAWDHPFRALPPDGSPRIAGGDTLIIAGGSYMMGYGAPGAGNCESDYAWDCYMPPIPGGSLGNPTRIVGAGWDAGCSDPPELWGTQRADTVLNLTDASHIELACLELTDHSSCVEFHTGGLACQRDIYPFGPWAAIGLYAEDSTNVSLHDLDVHGFALAGVHAGRLTDWTVEDVRIAGNGWVGWDGDIEDGDSNSGTLLFRRWTVEWNGCGETYPGEQPIGCWGQQAGGYGDGIGTGTTGGRWIIEDSAFLHNTSDGLDLLYTRLPGSSIEVRRTIAEGNAGNQIKTNGPTLIENSIIVGNCGFFEGQPSWNSDDSCRAAGNALALSLRPGNQATVVNSTLTSEGDCLVLAECEGTCNGSETVRLRNNIFQGQTDLFQPFENTCLAWAENFSHNPFDIDYSLITATKDTPPCPGPNDVCEVSPGLTNPSIDAFDAHLLPGSPAIDAGTLSGAPPDDFDAYPRYANPDIGAYEYSILKVTPTSRAIDPGGVATYTVEVRPIGGSASAVSLIASSPSPSLTLQLAPAQVIPPGQAILTLADSHPGPTLPSGLWYVVPITATDGVTQTTSVRLLVGGVWVYLPLILKSY